MFLYNLVAAIADFFGRASRNQPLTPAQRAFLRALDGVLVTIFTPAVEILVNTVWQWYNNQSTAVDWNAAIHAAATAALTSAIFVFMKYYRAKTGSGNGAGSVAPMQKNDVFNVQSGFAPVLTPAGNYRIIEAQATVLTPGTNGTNFPKLPASDGSLVASSSEANQ